MFKKIKMNIEITQKIKTQQTFSGKFCRQGMSTNDEVAFSCPSVFIPFKVINGTYSRPLAVVMRLCSV